MGIHRISRTTACSVAVALMVGVGAGCASHQPPTTEQARRQEQEHLEAQAKQQQKQAQIERHKQACADAETRKREEEREHSFMPDERDMRTVDEFVMASAAAGARNDAMLFPSHFDGARLNSAGKAKLFLMLENRREAPVNVYLDLPANDPLASQRLHALQHFLQKTGLGGPAVHIVQGENPNVRWAAVEGLMNYHKTDTHIEGTSGQGGYQPQPTPGVNMNASGQ